MPLDKYWLKKKSCQCTSKRWKSHFRESVLKFQGGSPNFSHRHRQRLLASFQILLCGHWPLTTGQERIAFVRSLSNIHTRLTEIWHFCGKQAVLFINLLGKGLTHEINGDGGSIWWAPAYVQYIKILIWLRGFLVTFLYLVWFPLCSSLFWELQDNGVVKNLEF